MRLRGERFTVSSRPQELAASPFLRFGRSLPKDSQSSSPTHADFLLIGIRYERNSLFYTLR